MQELIEILIEKCKEDLDKVKNLNELNNIRVDLLGKNGKFSQFMKQLKEVPPELKPEFGKNINTAKEKIESLIKEKQEFFTNEEINNRIRNERIDISLDLDSKESGSKHPLTIVREEILNIFTGMGFSIEDGPEIETDYYNFQALNIPKDHPARDMQDTFYITDNILLRTQTSSMQIRYMENKQPPIRIIVPGKVYRSDDDATHSPMFSQIEGLAVDKGLTLCDLKGVLELFAQKLFDKSSQVRFRPSYFPFTEPSVEVDVSCSICHGKGCRLCKGTGWIEILGAGIVNPVVLENCHIDSKVYSGFAFGLGIERVTMIKYGIPDMRILFENDVRFLKQFVKQGDNK